MGVAPPPGASAAWWRAGKMRSQGRSRYAPQRPGPRRTRIILTPIWKT